MNNRDFAPFILALLAVVVAIATFVFGDSSSQKLRIALGIIFFFIAVIMGAYGVVVLMVPEGQPPVAVEPTRVQPDDTDTLPPTATPTAVPSTDTPTPTPSPTPTIMPPTSTPMPLPSDTPTSSPPTNTPAPLPSDTPTPMPPTNTPTPIIEVSRFATVSLQPYSELIQASENLGLPAGLQNLNGVPFDFGWTSSTQCAYSPDRPTQMDIGMDIAQPTTVYVLLQAGWGMKDYAGKQIGAIGLTFSDDMSIEVPLILGENIRDWSIDESRGAVTTVTSSDVQEAWSGSSPAGILGRMDMITIPVLEVGGGNLTQVRILDLTETTTGSPDPCIHVLALTVLHVQ